MSVQHATSRLYLLDLLRGLASLCVVLWHYQHFFYIAPGVLPPDFHVDVQPFYSVLSLFYTHGARAVQLFFVLSGFIMFYHYADAVNDRRIGARTFFILRFSRLYPLHLATLGLVAAGQMLSYLIDGRSIVYACNDEAHFLANLLLVSYWLPTDMICWSFNGPSWSVSAEVFLYALFFLYMLILPRGHAGWLSATALVIVASVAAHKLGAFHLLGQPVFSFFAGGLAYLIWERATSHGWPMARTVIPSLAVLGTSAVYFYTRGVRDTMLDVLTFPALVLFLATVQSIRPNSGKNVRVIGDITYSTYLLHFPLQLGLLLLAKMGWVHIDYAQPAAWWLFFAFLLLISVPSYYLFERPVQVVLRNALLGIRRVAA